mmetsp:Transcript_8969/g.22971  ORF Transcript_8969/g.22971 Transcript_8969/m.22971 type:complete len:212 (+) Transcript_8969:95-730(+)
MSPCGWWHPLDVLGLPARLPLQRRQNLHGLRTELRDRALEEGRRLQHILRILASEVRLDVEQLSAEVPGQRRGGPRIRLPIDLGELRRHGLLEALPPRLRRARQGLPAEHRVRGVVARSGASEEQIHDDAHSEQVALRPGARETGLRSHIAGGATNVFGLRAAHGVHVDDADLNLKVVAVPGILKPRWRAPLPDAVLCGPPADGHLRVLGE